METRLLVRVGAVLILSFDVDKGWRLTRLLVRVGAVLIVWGRSRGNFSDASFRLFSFLSFSLSFFPLFETGSYHVVQAGLNSGHTR